ncbi:hypothetical protein [Humibacter sp. RRB41]|uniref:hypothetical protein n=1 Tax=Humibacter sp. RRB41 TaxID=2919946 RepID=UPI001FA9A105|nr:hypothetical protein [Humibacter sp. RRB41]
MTDPIGAVIRRRQQIGIVELENEVRRLQDALEAEHAEVERLRGEKHAAEQAAVGWRKTAERAEAELAEIRVEWGMDAWQKRAERAEAENARLTAQLQAVKHIAGMWESVAAVHHPDEMVYLVGTYTDHVEMLRNAILDAAADEPKPCTCGWGGVHDPDNPRCERNGGE